MVTLGGFLQPVHDLESSTEIVAEFPGFFRSFLQGGPLAVINGVINPINGHTNGYLENLVYHFC